MFLNINASPFQLRLQLLLLLLLFLCQTLLLKLKPGMFPVLFQLRSLLLNLEKPLLSLHLQLVTLCLYLLALLLDEGLLSGLGLMLLPTETCLLLLLCPHVRRILHSNVFRLGPVLLVLLPELLYLLVLFIRLENDVGDPVRTRHKRALGWLRYTVPRNFSYEGLDRVGVATLVGWCRLVSVPVFISPVLRVAPPTGRIRLPKRGIYVARSVKRLKPPPEGTAELLETDLHIGDIPTCVLEKT